MEEKKEFLKQLTTFVLWLAGILITLAVGFGMVDGTLTVRFLPLAMTQIAGWIAIASIVAGTILSIISRFSN